jgi:protein disulfide-isomerase A6
MKFLVFAFLWIACLHAVNALDFYTKKTGIVDLHSGNFRKLVKSGSSGLPWIVEFYAPWCGHCQQLKPEYIRMAAKLKGIVNVGAVDCDNKQNGMIASEYGIKGFPTIKVITADGKVHDYNGPRTSGGMYALNILFLSSYSYLLGRILF